MRKLSTAFQRLIKISNGIREKNVNYARLIQASVREIHERQVNIIVTLAINLLPFRCYVSSTKTCNQLCQIIYLKVSFTCTSITDIKSFLLNLPFTCKSFHVPSPANDRGAIKSSATVACNDVAPDRQCINIIGNPVKGQYMNATICNNKILCA